MAVSKKLKKIQQDLNVEELILKGGSSVSEEENQIKLEELRFHLRIPKEIVEKIDADRKSQGGFVSRNTWILQTILEKLNSKIG